MWHFNLVNSQLQWISGWEWTWTHIPKFTPGFAPCFDRLIMKMYRTPSWWRKKWRVKQALEILPFVVMISLLPQQVGTTGRNRNQYLANNWELKLICDTTSPIVVWENTHVWCCFADNWSSCIEISPTPFTWADMTEVVCLTTGYGFTITSTGSLLLFSNTIPKQYVLSSLFPCIFNLGVNPPVCKIV